MSENIYAPMQAKLIQTKHGQIMKVNFNAQRMIDFINQHVNEKGYVNLDISERKTEGKFGETHSIKLNTWVKDEDRQKMRGSEATPKSKEDNDEIPF